MSVEAITVVDGLMSRHPRRRDDPIELLPFNSAAKLRGMREEYERLKAIERATTEKLQDAIDNLHAAEARLRQLQGDAHTRRMAADDDPAMVQAVDARDRAAQEVEYRRELLTRHMEKRGQLGSLLQNNVERWIRGLSPDVHLEPFRSKSSPLRRNEKPLAGLKRLRGEVVDLKLAREAVNRSPSPSHEAKAMARDQVADLARRGAPDVLGLIERGAPISYPTSSASLALIAAVMLDGAPAVHGSARGEVRDGIAFMAWLDSGKLVARLEQEIDARSDDEAALSDDEKRQRLEELKALQLATEHAEEAAFCRCESTGLAVQRRLDADPRAVLGVTGPDPCGL